MRTPARKKPSSWLSGRSRKLPRNQFSMSDAAAVEPSLSCGQRMGSNRRGHRSRERFHGIRTGQLPGHPIRGVRRPGGPHVLTRPFDIIYMLNTFDAFDAQGDALAARRQVVQAGARLIIFDYLDRDRLAKDPLVVNVGKIVPHPIEMSRIPDDLAAAGWKLDSAKEVNDGTSAGMRTWLRESSASAPRSSRLGRRCLHLHARGVWRNAAEGQGWPVGRGAA